MECRLVFDTNVFVSALIIEKSTPDILVQKILSDSRFSIAYSAELLAELREVVQRKKFLRYKNFPDVALRFINRIEKISIAYSVPIVQKICSAPKDDFLLSLALEARANFLITGNLKDFPESPFQGLQIVNPTTFFNLVLA